MRLNVFLFFLGITVGIIFFGNVSSNDVNRKEIIFDTVYRIDTIFYEARPKIHYKKIYIKNQCDEVNSEYERLKPRW